MTEILLTAHVSSETESVCGGLCGCAGGRLAASKPVVAADCLLAVVESESQRMCQLLQS